MIKHDIKTDRNSKIDKNYFPEVCLGSCYNVTCPLTYNEGIIGQLIISIR